MDFLSFALVLLLFVLTAALAFAFEKLRTR
jgi:hypothetical protein